MHEALNDSERKSGIFFRALRRILFMHVYATLLQWDSFHAHPPFDIHEVIGLQLTLRLVPIIVAYTHLCSG